MSKFQRTYNYLNNLSKLGVTDFLANPSLLSVENRDVLYIYLLNYMETGSYEPKYLIENLKLPKVAKTKKSKAPPILEGKEEVKEQPPPSESKVETPVLPLESKVEPPVPPSPAARVEAPVLPLESKVEPPVPPSPAARVEPRLVPVLPEFLPYNLILDSLKAENKDDHAPQPQLPPPILEEQTDVRIQLFDKFEGVPNEISRKIANGLKTIVQKYFPNFNARNLDHHLKDPSESNIDFIFLIDTKANLRNYAQYNVLFQKLKTTGSLVLMYTDSEPEELPIYTHQLKRTYFLENEPNDLNNYFVKFFAGHIFYMKRNCSFHQDVTKCPALVTPSFATFTLPPSSVSPVLNMQTAEEFWILTMQPNKTLDVYRRTRNSPELSVFAENSYLPLNFMETWEAADKTSSTLSNSWSSVTDATRSTVHMREPVKVLFGIIDKYFKSFWVRGGGNCFFLALNMLFALKGMPLLTLELVVEAAMTFLSKFVAPLSQEQLEANAFFFFQTKERVIVGDVERERDYNVPTNKEETYRFVFNNLSHSVKELYFSDIIATFFNIKIVIVAMQQRGRPQWEFYSRKPVVSLQGGMPETDDTRSYPTFHVLNYEGHYYPLFPVKQVPEDGSQLM